MDFAHFHLHVHYVFSSFSDDDFQRVPCGSSYTDSIDLRQLEQGFRECV